MRHGSRVDGTLLAAVGLIAIGLVGVAGAGWVLFDAWTTRQAWDISPEAAALADQEAAPTPIWLAPATPQPISPNIQPLPTRQPVALPLLSVEPTEPPSATATPVVVVTADDLSLDASDFRFLDPPEPGAHARLALSLTNHSTASSDRIVLGIPQKWFDSYSIIGTAPAVSADQTSDDGLRTFSFPPVPGGERVDMELHVTATVEGTTPPRVTLELPDGSVIAEADKLSTLAPTPRPGPVMGIDIPRLKLKTGVVQTAWEPPPFAVGQIKGTANITRGNSVVVGHLTGAAGNVFAHLDQLEPGDEITATSRGVPYAFVVSKIFTGENVDQSPMAPDENADQITHMTCAGVWNPFTRDYSERLWVVAEPAERAKVTIAQVAATATAQATAGMAATATARVDATSTAQALPTATPVPTPYAGEPAPAGGIGNTRPNVEKAFGFATGETSISKLAVFRPRDAPPREVHVHFTPDPQRAALVSIAFNAPVAYDAAVAESRKLLPTDTRSRTAAPEGNPQFIVERFVSVSLEQALGNGEFSVIYTRDARGAVTSVILGLGNDLTALMEQAAH